MGAYLLICKEKTAEEAWSFFEKVDPPFKPFRDAISGECTYQCTVIKIEYKIIFFILKRSWIV